MSFFIITFMWVVSLSFGGFTVSLYIVLGATKIAISSGTLEALIIVLNLHTRSFLHLQPSTWPAQLSADLWSWTCLHLRSGPGLWTMVENHRLYYPFELCLLSGLLPFLMVLICICFHDKWWLVVTFQCIIIFKETLKESFRTSDPQVSVNL